jgi:ABC-type glycerol-3-phosphate transport system permease component
VIDTAAPVHQSLPRAGGRRLLARIKPPRVALNVLLIVVALLWLMPTITLAIISFRPESRYESSGWWKVLAETSQLTLSN